MKTVLFVTVGGSPQPIVTSIQTLKPDRVIFVCSDGTKGSISQVVGSGNPCEIRQGSEVISRLPNIPTQVKLNTFNPETDVIAIQDPDDLAGSYALIMTKFREFDSSFRTFADYTGGTKTMSVSLALAALESGAEIVLTTGDRTNLIRINQGEMTERVNSTPVIFQRFLEKEIPNYLEDYDYGAALLKLKQWATHPLTQDQRQRIRTLHKLCKGFDAWDRFEHAAAFGYLKDYLKDPNFTQRGLFLKRVIHSRSLLLPDTDPSLGTPGHGYEVVQDLLLNAQRRAHQRRYDDAVGRIYRALELLAQVRLKLAYDLETGNINLQKLPNSLQTYYQDKQTEKDKIQLALIASFRLLSQLEGDPLGEHYLNFQDQIRDTLQIRNNSILAHGFRPVTESDYETKIVRILVLFIESSLDMVVPAKFKDDLLSINALQMPTHF